MAQSILSLGTGPDDLILGLKKGEEESVLVRYGTEGHDYFNASSISRHAGSFYELKHRDWSPLIVITIMEIFKC
jgi:hypothetical protein